MGLTILLTHTRGISLRSDRLCTLRVHKVLEALVLLAVKVQMETPARKVTLSHFGRLSFEALELVSPACPEARVEKWALCAALWRALHLPTHTVPHLKHATEVHCGDVPPQALIGQKTPVAATQRQHTVTIAAAFSIVLSRRKDSAQQQLRRRLFTVKTRLLRVCAWAGLQLKQP